MTWFELAQLVALVVVPVVAWLTKRIHDVNARIGDNERRLDILESHDLAVTIQGVHGRITEVATGVAEVRGELRQLNQTSRLIQQALMKDE